MACVVKTPLDAESDAVIDEVDVDATGVYIDVNVADVADVVDLYKEVDDLYEENYQNQMSSVIILSAALAAGGVEHDPLPLNPRKIMIKINTKK